MSEGPVINRKAGRSTTPTKARPSEPSPAPESAAAPAAESAQETTTKRTKASNFLQSNLDLQVQAKVWNFSGSYSFWDNLGTWKTLIYVLIAWALYESFWEIVVGKAATYKELALTLLYRLLVLGTLVLFGIHWKNDVCKDKSISEWYWGSFRRTSPFLANVFEGGVIMAASQLSLQLYTHWWANDKALADFSLNWNAVKIMVIVSAFYVTPVLTVFYKWVNENWTIGGKWGNALFTQLVFSPVFMIFLFIFLEWTTALVNGGALWNGNVWELIKSKFWYLNTFPATADQWRDPVYPYLSKQAINFVFWFPQTAFANFFVPAEYTLAFGAICNFAWNIVFEVLVR